MKKFSASVLLSSVAIVLLTGCAMVTPMNGSLYTSLNGPVAVGSASGSDKRGEAKSTAIIGIATGDSSIEAAMQNGGITKIHHVDCKVMNVLGVYATYTTIAYGE